jgi:hypothetical protein
VKLPKLSNNIVNVKFNKVSNNNLANLGSLNSLHNPFNSISITNNNQISDYNKNNQSMEFQNTTQYSRNFTINNKALNKKVKNLFKFYYYNFLI